MRLISYFSENSKGSSSAKKIYNYHKLKLSVIYLSINSSFFWCMQDFLWIYKYQFMVCLLMLQTLIFQLLLPAYTNLFSGKQLSSAEMGELDRKRVRRPLHFLTMKFLSCSYHKVRLYQLFFIAMSISVNFCFNNRCLNVSYKYYTNCSTGWIIYVHLFLSFNQPIQQVAVKRKWQYVLPS